LDQNAQGAHATLIGGYMGAEILSRFDLIIDAPHRSIYLKPNPKHSLPFPAITISGFGYKALRDDYKTVVVHTVIPGSPAEKAGIKPGDLIVKINGQSVDGVPFSATYATLHQPQTHLLVVKRGTELIDIKLEPIVIR
jgi:C-terminal processing protease CtpA/Prc